MLSRRKFLAMFGVLVGVGAAGGLAWLRPGDTGVQSQAAETAPSADVASSNPDVTNPVGSGSATTTEATRATVPSTTSRVPDVAMSRLEIICREAWLAAPARGRFTEHAIERLTVHHTGVVMDANKAAPARVRSYQTYHQEAGWPDVAYHYLIDAHGHIYEGRPASARGDTFTEYDPTGHFLVCCDGDFNRQDIPVAQLASLAAVLAWASVRFAVEPSTVAGHRDFAVTTCPGSHLSDLIIDGTLRSMVDRLIATGGVSVDLLCGQAGLDRVAAIEAGHV